MNNRRLEAARQFARLNRVNRMYGAREAWLVTGAFCFAFVVKTAVVYWAQGATTRWTIADMRWGVAFYLDLLVVMAVGILSPLMALPAWLAALRVAPDPPPARAAEAAREVV